MTQATDTDIRELKTAIATQSDRIDTIGRGTEANTRAIETLSRTNESVARAIEANTKILATHSERIEGLTKATEANTKAIADLTSSFGGLREEMRVGFSEMKGQINTLDAKFDERSKGMGQRLDGKELAQRNIFTGITVLIVGGILLAFFKYLFFGTLP
jgi:chromosome segregation ATPase